MEVDEVVAAVETADATIAIKKDTWPVNALRATVANNINFLGNVCYIHLLLAYYEIQNLYNIE